MLNFSAFIEIIFLFSPFYFVTLVKNIDFIMINKTWNSWDKGNTIKEAPN